MPFIISLLGSKNGRSKFINRIDCKPTKLSSGVRKLDYLIKHWNIVLYDIDEGFGDEYLNKCDGILHFCFGGKLRTWKTLPVIHCYEEKNTTEIVMKMIKIIEDIYCSPILRKKFIICLIGDNDYICDTMDSYDSDPKRITSSVLKIDVDNIFGCSVIIYGLYLPMGKYLDDCDGVVHFCSRRGTRYKSLVPVVYHSTDSNFDPVERLILRILGY